MPTDWDLSPNTLNPAPFPGMEGFSQQQCRSQHTHIHPHLLLPKSQHDRLTQQARVTTGISVLINIFISEKIRHSGSITAYSSRSTSF